MRRTLAALEKLTPILYWASWPLNYVYVKGTQRTRVLLCADNKILLVKGIHSDGKWSLPGGGLHKDEQPEYGATRELMEETGIAIGIEKLQFMAAHQHHEHKLHYTGLYYLAELSQPLPAMPKLPEIVRAKWIAEADLTQYKLGPDVVRALSLRSTVVQ